MEAQLGPNGELNEISGFANKMAEQAARIAAVLTKFEDPDATEIDELMVSRGSCSHSITRMQRCGSMVRVE